MSMITPETQSKPSSPPSPGIAGFRQVLKNRNFVLLWLAQLISLTILNAANFGIIVIVNNVTHSVVMAGIAIIAFTLPALPFSAVAGAIVDRLNKRLVLWISNVLRAGTMLLIVISLLFNITMTLSQAIGFLLLGGLVSRIFPPFTLQLAGLTLHVQSIDMLFVLVAFLYLVCAALILCIPTRAFTEKHIEREKSTSGEAGKALEKIWREIVEGWQFVRKDRVLFFAVIQLSVVGNIMLLIGELAGTFVQQVLHRPAEDMVIILAPAAIGLVGASILMPPITQRVGRIRLTVIGFIVLAVGFLLLPTSEWVALHL